MSLFGCVDALRGKLESGRYYEHDRAISVVINHYYWTIKRRYFETTRQWFTDDQRYSTYNSVERAVLGSLANPEATFDISVAASTTPWAARLTASDVQSFLSKQSEKLKQLEESVQKHAP